MNIEIYTRLNCIWCDRAKELLKSLNLYYVEHDLSDDVKRNNFYLSIGENVKTVPQIFIDGVRIGGFQELKLYLNE